MAELRVSTRALSVLCLSLAAFAPSVAAQERLQSSDFLRLRSVGAVRFSPDGSKIAYTVTNNDGPGGPYSQLWLVETATGNSTRIGDETSRGGQPVWSPDGRWIAYMGSTGGRAGLIVARDDGTSPAWIADVADTNSSALTNTGRTIAWSPDSKTIAFVPRLPGPRRRTPAATRGDHALSLQADAAEGNTRFNDNRRLHIFLLDVATGRSRQLTTACTTSTRSTGRRTATRSCSSPTASRTRISSSTTISSLCASPTARSGA